MIRGRCCLVDTTIGTSISSCTGSGVGGRSHTEIDRGCEIYLMCQLSNNSLAFIRGGQPPNIKTPIDNSYIQRGFEIEVKFDQQKWQLKAFEHLKLNPQILNRLLTFGGEFRGLKMASFKIKVTFHQQK